MEHLFKQIYVGDFKTPLPKVFAVIALSPSELTETRGIQFETMRDDLDYCKGALLELPDGQQFALRSYFRGPNPDKTELLGDEHSKDAAKDTRRFLSALGMDKNLVLFSIIEHPY